MYKGPAQLLFGLHIRTQNHTFFKKNEASLQPLRGYPQTLVEENHEENAKYYLHTKPL